MAGPYTEPSCSIRTCGGHRFLTSIWAEGLPTSIRQLRPRGIAVLGLGSGAVAAYVKKADSITYYEIDPDNEKIARQWFTYLDDCKVNVRVIVGDGRLSMQKSGGTGHDYDIIHMDAFTGDGIPHTC